MSSSDTCRHDAEPLIYADWPEDIAAVLQPHDHR